MSPYQETLLTLFVKYTSIKLKNIKLKLKKNFYTQEITFHVSSKSLFTQRINTIPDFSH